MAERGHDAGGRPGCVPGRLFGALARLILVYPLVSIGSRLAQAGQTSLWPEVGTPYEGAFVGAVVGLAIGISLWLSAIVTVGWRARLAETALASVCVIWLGAIVGVATGHLAAADVTAPWAVCLAGAGAVAVLLRI